MALLLTMGLAQTQAQVTEAERAAEAARKAAEAAAAKRQEATAGQKPLASDEFMRIAEEQERMKREARERRGLKAKKKDTPEQDSLRRAENFMKLRTWNYKWFVGGNVSTNFCFADNVTDHPPFRYFSDAMGLGAEVYAGRYFSKKFAARVGLGFHNVKNRVDYETVDQAWHGSQMVTSDGKKLYTGNGFFRFGVTELYTDAMFDVSGLASARYFRPLHVHVILGVGMLASGTKKLKDGGTLNSLEQTPIDPENPGKGQFYVVEGRTTGAATFESRVKTKSHVGICGRAGLMFDYRFSKSMSANLELTASVTDDKFEGIKYDEPFDVLLKLSAGVKWHF